MESEIKIWNEKDFDTDEVSAQKTSLDDWNAKFRKENPDVIKVIETAIKEGCPSEYLDRHESVNVRLNVAYMMWWFYHDNGIPMNYRIEQEFNYLFL